MSCSTHTIPQLLSELKLLLGDKSLLPRSILYINAHVYNLAAENSELAAKIRAARVITADGMGIVWAAPLFGTRLPERCNMTEAFRFFLKDTAMPPNRAILIGCSEKEAAAAAESATCASTHCRIVKSFSGFLNNDQYRQIFSEYCDVDFIFLGMGTPRSEQVAELAMAIAPRAVTWAIGGGTIRIYAGEMKEAPAIWRRAGLQWLHRMLSEPGTLWRRYLIGNPLFVVRILRELIRQKFARSAR